MTAVRTMRVADDEAALRLDRWFRRHCPGVTHGRLEKLLRTGQVRIDGRRAKSNHRLEAGQMVRVPPLDSDAEAGPVRAAPIEIDEHEAAAIRARVLHRDRDCLVIDKPAGLPIQGGPGIRVHLDALLDALEFDADERPRLVHRLDRDTSGVLVLARHARAAAFMAEAFRRRTARKLYWAITVGVPVPSAGRIDAPLEKLAGPQGERMVAGEGGQSAITDYRVLDRAATAAAFVKLLPHTGRTHQLRVHCAAIGTPILGDGKYGGAAAHISGGEIAAQLHLHGRAIELPKMDGGVLRVVAPLPPHIRDAFRFFGFEGGPARVRAEDFEI
ncbi:MAG: RluA family pseudouridine synthase [Rhodospirillaceae bacterium]|nr:RluA family pseudouridine synthase [Rhodospirillaceae bacterium]